ncbi:hypothetical protein DFQ04_3032 [Algoriphagus boseongensis]|uniref:Uncharacterized protein n=1 Tax=Algoriphagus boseongensis TaxID=1442587 RepID=A0A4R6T5W3_9BACT|nr:hypothetical protein DFQ04_3032 [Algoriphagus boseongensis]
MAIILLQIIRTSFSGPGLERFEGKLEEVGFFRNENNTGPVLRVYAVKVIEADRETMRAFADAQPHTKYGRTLVFFFSDQIPEKVELAPVEPYFPQEYLPLLLAKFEKTPMGEGRFEVVQP